MELLTEIKDRLKEEEFEWYKGKVQEEDKKILMMFKCFKLNKDMDDLINSMQRLYSRQKK